MNHRLQLLEYKFIDEKSMPKGFDYHESLLQMKYDFDEMVESFESVSSEFD